MGDEGLSWGRIGISAVADGLHRWLERRYGSMMFTGADYAARSTLR